MGRDRRYDEYIISTNELNELDEQKVGSQNPKLETENSSFLDKAKPELSNSKIVNSEKLSSLLNEDATTVNHEKLKIESMLLYYSINNEIVKLERVLRDTKSVRNILVQKYYRAKENLTLHDRILSSQTDDARNYFGLLCAIYDCVVKYTLPSAKLVAELSKLQSEIETQEKSSSELIDTITDSLQPLNIPSKIMPKNSKDEDISQMFEEMAKFIETNRTKYSKLEKNAKDIYEMSVRQRDRIQEDITVILHNISDTTNKLVVVDDDYNKARNNIEQLLNYMQVKLHIQVKESIPMLE